MTKNLVVLAAFIAGGAIVTGTAFALTDAPAVAPTTMSGAMSVASSSVGVTKLTIQHVQKGCHVLSDGSRQVASMRLSLKPGARVQLLDQDIDPHGLVQLAGPKLQIKGHMMMGERQTITFKQAGVYRLKTRVIEMGKMVNVKTIGPDNTLRLTVSVK